LIYNSLGFDVKSTIGPKWLLIRPCSFYELSQFVEILKILKTLQIFKILTRKFESLYQFDVCHFMIILSFPFATVPRARLQPEYCFSFSIIVETSHTTKTRRYSIRNTEVMSNITTTNNFGNPLLYQFPESELIVQPYWILVLQLLFIQFLSRLWNRCKYNTWFTAVEAYFVNYDKSRIGVDWFDILFVLPQIAHIIWYGVQQSKCMSYQDATTWKCYNIFGYKIANYVLVQGSGIYSNITFKLIIHKKQNGVFMIVVGSLTIVLAIGITIPYSITNIIPMTCAYIWIVGIYTVVGILICLVLITCLQITEDKDCMQLFLGSVVSFANSLALYMYPTLYNYSQYLYFGDSYLHTIYSEYQSRNTQEYFQQLANTTESAGHLILSTF
jgi:hypothetical protein